MPEGPVWPRLDAPLWLSPLRTRGSRLFDLPDGNCAARSTTHVRLPVVAASLLRECEPSRSSSRWFSAERRDLSESSEFAVHAARVSRQYRLAALFNNRLNSPWEQWNARMRLDHSLCGLFLPHPPGCSQPIATERNIANEGVAITSQLSAKLRSMQVSEAPTRKLRHMEPPPG